MIKGESIFGENQVHKNYSCSYIKKNNTFKIIINMSDTKITMYTHVYLTCNV